MLTLASITLLTAATTQSRNIQDYLQSEIKDISIVAKVLQANQSELKKIKEDFGRQYRMDSWTIRYKEPFKLRIDSRVEDTNYSAIYNGTILKMGGGGLSARQDLKHDTARRETIFDFGLLVPELFPSFFKARFVRTDRETGEPVFDVTYADPEEQARYRTWIDPVHKIATKREWYNRYGTQLATFYYQSPKQFDGVWIPTVIVVKNIDNKVAGSTRYDSIKVNAGIADSVFSVGR